MDRMLKTVKDELDTAQEKLRNYEDQLNTYLSDNTTHLLKEKLKFWKLKAEQSHMETQRMKGDIKQLENEAGMLVVVTNNKRKSLSPKNCMGEVSKLQVELSNSKTDIERLQNTAMDLTNQKNLYTNSNEKQKERLRNQKLILENGNSVEGTRSDWYALSKNVAKNKALTGEMNSLISSIESLMEENVELNAWKETFDKHMAKVNLTHQQVLQAEQINKDLRDENARLKASPPQILDAVTIDRELNRTWLMQESLDAERGELKTQFKQLTSELGHSLAQTQQDMNHMSKRVQLAREKHELWAQIRDLRSKLDN